MESFFQFGALLSAMTWALSGSILKTIKLNKIFSFPFFESIVSLVIIGTLILILRDWNSILNENLNTIKLFLIASVVSCIGSVFYIVSIQRTSISIVFTICASSNVLMTLILDYIFNSVRHSNMVLIGCLLILSSILMINIKNFKSKELNLIIGILGGVMAGSLWGFAVYFNDKALIEGSVLSGSLIRAVVGISTLFLASLIFSQKIEFINNSIHQSKIIIAGALITFSSLIWFVSLENTSGSLTAMFGSTAPIFAIILGYLFLKERLFRNEVIGIGLAFIGIIIIIIFKN
ncbi:MAG: EamA family transporter [Dehalococcoidales bacterium]|jgi:drug/metabolite transporter (DMT)-like permease|nr:EamA family transporter [Dehalococcoidales bacterium]